MGLVLRSAPFVAIGTALFTGVWLAARFEIPAWNAALLFAVAALGAVGSIVLRAKWATRWLLMTASVLAAGMVRFALTTPEPPPLSLARLSGERVRFEGVIDEEPEYRPTAVHLRVRVTRCFAPAIPCAEGETVLVRTQADETWRYGDVVRVVGVVDLPPRMSAFDYRRYLAYRGVFAWIPRPEQVVRLGHQPRSALYAQLLAAKDAVRRAVQRALPMPESALLNGILIGDDRLLPESLKEDFRITGTAHIVAISGANVSLMIALVVTLLGRVLHRRAAALAALPVIALYTLFVGAPASAVRAASMAALGLLGQLFWRRGFTLNTLFAACTFIVLVNPVALFDAGFQLSAAATLGLVLFAERLAAPTRAWFERHVPHALLRKGLNVVSDGVLVTLAAQLTTLPLLILSFHQVSLVALLSNLLILPLQPPIMLLGMGSALVSILVPELAPWAALPVRLLLTLTIRAVRWTADFPFAALPVYEIGALGVALAYAASVLLFWFRAQPRFVQHAMLTSLRRDARRWLLVSGSAAVLSVGLLVWFQRPLPQGRLMLRESNAVVQTPSGSQLLFVRRGDALALLRAVQPLWDNEVEWVVMSHADRIAQEAALPVLQRYRVGTLVLPAQPAEGDADLEHEWRIAIRNAQHVISSALHLTHTVDVATFVRFVPRKPARGAQVIGAHVRHGLVLIDLAGEGEPARLEPQTRLLFVAPRALSAAMLAQATPQWVVWADAPGNPPPLPRATRSVSLRQAEWAAFVFDQNQLQRAR